MGKEGLKDSTLTEHIEDKTDKGRQQANFLTSFWIGSLAKGKTAKGDKGQEIVRHYDCLHPEGHGIYKKRVNSFIVKIAEPFQYNVANLPS